MEFFGLSCDAQWLCNCFVATSDTGKPKNHDEILDTMEQWKAAKIEKGWA